MKKIIAFIVALFAAPINTIKQMDRESRNKLKSYAFDSYDDDNYDDDNYDDDNYDEEGYDSDNITGKRKARPTGKKTGSFKPTSGYFTIQVVNGIAALQQIELFSSLRSAAFCTNTTLFPTYLPFTAVNRAAANLNSVIYFDAAGNLIIQSSAGTLCTISCKQIPYRTLLESMKFYRIRVKETKMTFLTDSSLDNDITHRTQTLMGKNETNSFTPRVYFKDMQFATKQVTIPVPYDIDGERGLEMIVNASETLTFTFTLSGISKAN